jgi:hypothetical protein
MLHKYLVADDTPLNAAISRKMIKIVRRARKPGCKSITSLCCRVPRAS